MDDQRQKELEAFCKEMVLEILDIADDADEVLVMHFNMMIHILMEIARSDYKIGTPAHKNIKQLNSIITSYKDILEQQVLELYE